MKRYLDKIFYTLSIVMFLCFLVFIVKEYIEYDPLVTSAPFYVNIIVGLVCFILPGLVFFVIGYLCKKKFNKDGSNMTNLSENELENVAGGVNREKTITVSVEVPDSFNEDINIKAYLDGELQSSLCRIVDCSVRVVNMNVIGRTGVKQLKVKFNNIVSKTYELDFDTCSYRQI